jgi:hypothetical protein
MWMPLRSLILAALLLTAGIDLAYAQIVTERVQFAHGSSSATIKGTLKGDQTRDYVLGAKAGQTMHVQLTTRSNLYFNVLPPHSDQAIYVGQTQADPHHWSGTLPTDGEYTIRVYAMGAARDGAKQHNFACAVSIK